MKKAHGEAHGGSNVKAYDFARYLTGGLKKGIDVKNAAAALRSIADDLVAHRVLLHEVQVVTKTKVEDYVTTTVILSLVETQQKEDDPGMGE